MPGSPFIVHVAPMQRRIGSRRQLQCCGPVATSGDTGVVHVTDSVVPTGADVCCELTLESFPGGLMAHGTIEAPWQGSCRRCTIDVGGRVVVSFRERFTPAGGTGEDEEAYPIADDAIDLEPMVRDTLVLELPAAPLCGESCLGLCPICGANRNEDPCSCEPPRDPRWASLDVLRQQPDRSEDDWTQPGQAAHVESARDRL